MHLSTNQIQLARSHTLNRTILLYLHLFLNTHAILSCPSKIAHSVSLVAFSLNVGVGFGLPLFTLLHIMATLRLLAC